MTAPPGSELSIAQLIDALMFKLNSENERDREDCTSTNLQDFEEKLVTATLIVRSHRNTLVPINRLPPEILAIVFDKMQIRLPSFILLSGSALRHSRLSSWRAVLKVCRKWRDTALAFPALFSIIDSATSSCNHLERSSSAPLTVYLGMYASPLMNVTEELAQKLTPSISRFEQFHVDLEKCPVDVPLLDMFHTPAPLLESITIAKSGRRDIVHTLPTLFNGQTPRLRQLNLEHFTSWPGNQFVDLTHLCLYNQDPDSRQTLSQFLNFIDACRRLEELVLVNAGPMVDDEPAASPRRLIALNELRELSIGKGPNAALISRFLSHVIIPRGTRMYIWSNRLLGDHEELPFLLPSDCSHLHNFDGVQEIRYSHMDTGLNLIAITGAVLYIYGSFDAVQVLSALSHTMALDVIQDVWIQDTPMFSCTTDEWRGFFAALPSLTHLGISGGASRTVLSTLRESYGDDNEVDSFLCPSLYTLRIAEDRDLPAFFLCTFAEERARQGIPIENLTITMSRWLPANDGWGVQNNWDGVESDYGWGGPPGHAWDNNDDNWGGWGSLPPPSPAPLSQLGEDLRYMNKYVKNVEHDNKMLPADVMMPSQWPSPAYKWTVRRSTRR